MSIDRIIDDAMRPVADAVAGVVFFRVPLLGAELPLIVAWLVGGGLFFTFYLRFINLRGFVEALRIVSGRRAGPADPGEIPQFQALTTAVSGTVGIGNMAGVAVAISTGGPGATFWLVVAGLLGMSTKFAECTLGVRFRREHADGSVSGGPMYYLAEGLRTLRRPRLGRALGAFYAAAMMVGCLGIGNMFQSNQAAALFVDVTGGEAGLLRRPGVADRPAARRPRRRWSSSAASGRSPARRSDWSPPWRSCTSLWRSPSSRSTRARSRRPRRDLAGRVRAEGVAGGALGALVIGFRRAAFSNEAGLGSAAIAHATARTARPVSEGYVGLLEPFIDTVVICTMTALVIVTTVYDPTLAGCRGERHRADHARVHVHAVVVGARPRRGRHAVRLLDDDRLGLLRPQGLHLPGRRGPRAGPRLQAVLLRLRRHRGQRRPRRGGRSVGRPRLRGRGAEPGGAST